MVKELPIVIHTDEELFCFFDERLKQLRDIYNPSNFWDLNEFEVEYYKNAETFNDAIYQRV